MNGKKFTNLVTSGLLASTLILSAGAGAVYAEGDVTSVDQTETIVDDTATDTSATTEVTTDADEDQVTQDETVIDENQTAQDETADEEKAPSLVPGDFFYFVKIMTEKIRLAATFDDYKEAKLLADFAAERIAESNALLSEGKTEEAAELLKEAIATQEQANDELADSEDAVEDQDAKTDGTAEVKLLNNVNGLVNALSHVKNETAQKRIMRNLEKSFAKLDKKLSKLEKKDAKLAEKKKRIEEKLAGKSSDDEAAPEKGHKGKALGKQKVKKAEAAEIEESSTTPEQAATVENEAATTTEVTQTKADVKPNSASEKGAEKQAQAAARAAEKQAQAAAKAAEKQAKAEQKKVQAQEKQNKPANNGQGNKGEKGNEKGNN